MHGTLQWVSFFSSSANKKQKKQKQNLIGQHTNSGNKKERTLTFKKGLSDANTSFLFRRRSASYFAPSVGSLSPLPFNAAFLDFFFDVDLAVVVVVVVAEAYLLFLVGDEINRL